MFELIELFANNLLPIFLVAGFGFLLGKAFKVPPRPISQMVFFLFSPCLAFNLIITSEVGWDGILRMFGFATVIVLLIGLAAWVAGRALGLERKLLVAVVICCMFMNSGNYGMPVVNFAFGETALAYAVPFFVSISILSNTVGVFVASMGSLNVRQALMGILRMPVVYAVVAALIVKSLGWVLPVPVERSIQMLGNAAIPTMLVLLGLQLQVVRLAGQTRALFLVTSLRLVAGPILALLLSPIFALQGFAFQAGVLESAMPVAVLNTVLATEFDAEPTFVSSAVFISTLLSPFTVTPILFWLGA